MQCRTTQRTRCEEPQGQLLRMSEPLAMHPASSESFIFPLNCLPGPTRYWSYGIAGDAEKQCGGAPTEPAEMGSNCIDSNTMSSYEGK